MNNKQFAILLTITFFVGMVWLAADIIFRTKASIPISPKLQSLLEPINPNFDSRVLNNIDKETLEKSPAIIPSSSPSPLASIAPVISPSPSTQASGSAITNLSGLEPTIP